VKRAATGLDCFVKDFEQEEMERRIYAPALIPKAWQPEMRMFTEGEFVSKVTIDGQVRHTTSDTITESYNQDLYNPVDGELVKAADDLAAFMQAY
jgi:putative hydrolases of HD superfamily